LFSLAYAIRALRRLLITPPMVERTAINNFALQNLRSYCRIAGISPVVRVVKPQPGECNNLVGIIAIRAFYANVERSVAAMLPNAVNPVVKALKVTLRHSISNSEWTI
jgi:hypothetical protein